MSLIIGSHVSFKKDDQMVGSVKEAIGYGSNAFMIYTGAPQNTARNEIDLDLLEQAKQLMKENNIDINNVIVHAPYIVNLANREKLDFSISFLKQEVSRVNELGLKFLVLHPGNHVMYTKEEAINNISYGLNQVLKENKEVYICLETMSGKGTEIGTTIDEIKAIIDKIDNKEMIKVCLDTCHINDSGFDIKNIDEYFKEFDKKIGLDKIACIHINDSLNELGASKDRHANIGFGKIGFDNLIKVIYHDVLKDVPKILETPYIKRLDGNKYPPYKFEIEMIKNKEFNKNLLNDIESYYKEV